MIDKMMERVAILTGLPNAKPPRKVEVFTFDAMPDQYKKYWAYYDPNTQGIVLRDDYQHLLPHELTHHLQARSGTNPISDEAEKQAKWVQSIYWQLWPEDYDEEWDT